MHRIKGMKFIPDFICKIMNYHILLSIQVSISA